MLSVVNVGKSDASLEITLNGSNNIECLDLLKGISVSATPTLKPNELYFVEIKKEK